MGNKVKGIKYGPWNKYAALGAIDPDTLYFITDKGGTVYKGSELVLPSRVIESVTTGTTAVGTGTQYYYSFEIEAFNQNSASSTNIPTAPTKYSFDVYTKEAVDAIRTVLEAALAAHIATIGNSSTYGHVKLTDTIDESNLLDAASGTATTPKAVYDYVKAHMSAVDAMVVAGTITVSNGVIKIHSHNSDLEFGITITDDTTTLPSITKYNAGYTWKVASSDGSAITGLDKPLEAGDMLMAVDDITGTTFSMSDWTAIQGNIEGAVTAANNLDQNTLVLGDGDKTVKKLANGSAGMYLRIENGVPTWVNHPNADHGIAKCICSTTGTTHTKTATMVDSNAGTYKLVSGAIVAVKFDDFVSNKTGDVTLNVESTGAKLVYFRDAKIQEGVILAGDTATFIYNGTYWDLIAINKHFSDVAVSGDYDDLIHKAVIYAVNNETATTVNRTLTLSDYTYQADSNKILIVKFTNGITYVEDVQNPPVPTLTIKHSVSETYLSQKVIKWHGQNLGPRDILAGDTVQLAYDGTNFNVLSIDRKIDETPTSGSTNFITSWGVWSALQDAMLWWEPLN